jgi:hypothetical protein
LGALLVGLAAAPVAAQTINVTAPNSATPVAAANDFATIVMQDPWDMSQNTDGGWFVHSVDSPSAGWSSASFSGGLFSGVVAGNAFPNLWLLETGFAGAAPVGRFGLNFPIDANRFRIAAVRMCVSQPNAAMLFGWTTQTMFDAPGLQYSNNVFTTSGCRFYIVDLPTLGVGSGVQPWSGTKRSLMIVPAAGPTAGSSVNIDWVRLVENQPSLVGNITWSGTGPVDIYLDNNNSATNDPNQTLGLVASGVNGTSYPLNVGALQPGNYYVAIRRTGTTVNFSYSSGFYQVNAPATITVTSPSDEGSSDDFATVQLNNAWDMTSLSDIDHLINVSSPSIATIPGAETEAGTPLGSITTFFGTSTVGEFHPEPCASFAKPAVFPMHSNVRGLTRRIDPNRYRILTAELGLPNKARDICGGSIVRIVWHVAGDANETYSDDIILNSRAGANVLSRLNMDMATLAIEPGSPSQTGWVPGFSPNPGVMTFRIDPHEFANPTAFFIKRMKLAALDVAHTSFNVQWTTSKTGGTINVYYDVDKDPASKSVVVGSATASALTGSLSWNTSGLPDGAQYFVYVEHDDGTNVNGAYSKWPVVIDHTPNTARLVLNRSRLNFGVLAQTIKTPPQVLQLSVLNAPAGTPCWTASSDLPFLVVTPASGCGGTSLTVSLVGGAIPSLGNYAGSIRITSPNANNSPQFVPAYVSLKSASTPPTGAVDTPANGAIVSGSVAVTGWAIDDIGIARVTICRSPIAGDGPPNPACGPNQVYVGDAVSISDARPDIEGYSPTTPLNYRAGWGFLVLTNMLPNQGNGVFTLHMNAIDLEGRMGALGSRVIDVRNNAAQEPFGALDTPGQGETISGTNYANFGWVLSRVRRADPPGGGHVFVYIDGVAVGSPAGWNSRADLTALFPGYPGIGTALGVYNFNTYAYANGLHTIVWVVSDVAGLTSGVGSRFFSVFNADNAMTASAGSAMRPAGPDLGRRIDDLGGRTVAAPVGVREGFGLTTPLRTASLGIDGTRRVSTMERDRIEIRLDGQTRSTDTGARNFSAASSVSASASSTDRYAGYLVVDGELRELPNGSSFDPSRGAFYWQPGLGYVGNYDLLFVRTGADGARERIPVRVTLQDRPTTALAARLSGLSGPWASVTFDR